MSVTSTSAASVQVVDFESSCPLIRCGCLVCAFCSSDQRFAYSFLQIPPRDGHPCCSASSSLCRVCIGLQPTKMPFGKGPPGSRLEIALELDGPLPVAKGNGVLDAPGFEFRGIRHITGVVPAQAVLEVVGQPDIETGGIRRAWELIQEYTRKTWELKKWPAIRSREPHFQHSPPTLQRRSYEGHHPPPGTRVPGGGWWRRRELNPRPKQTYQPRLHA